MKHHAFKFNLAQLHVEAQHFIPCLYFIYMSKIYMYVRVTENYATVEIHPKAHT